MTTHGSYQQLVECACSTEPGIEESRKEACDGITQAINERKFTILDLAVSLAVPLTSPEKEARENATRLLGEVVGRCRGVLGAGELHTLAEFLAARLRDWPCVGVAAAACRALLQQPPPGSGGSGGAAVLRDDSAALVLEAATEVLRSAQSFRQEERSALLGLLVAAARGWGRVAGGPAGQSRGVDLLDGFLGAADGEKDPRCLLLAFEAVKALCEMYHDPRVDPAPLRRLADELVDWASCYFPVSFNPPPAARAGGDPAITRAQLAGALEGALSASPFLAGGVLPLLVEKLSSAYRPAKEDSLSAMRRCCPAFGPDALAQHAGQLWPALRGEILAPCGRGPGGTVIAAGPPPPPLPGGGAGDAALETLAADAAGCLTVVVRAAGPGVADALALQDPFVGDVLSIARGAGSATHGSGAPGVLARSDRQVLCGALLLGAICAAGPAALLRAHTTVLGELQTLVRTWSLSGASAEPLRGGTSDGSYGSSNDDDVGADQTLYGMTLLTAVVDAVAADMAGAGAAATTGPADPPEAGAAAAAGGTTAAADGSWFSVISQGSGSGGGGAAGAGVTALAAVKDTLLEALHAVHRRLHPDVAVDGAAGIAASGTAEPLTAAAAAPLTGTPDVDMTAAPVATPTASAAELRLACIGAWKALLHLHRAAAAAAAVAASPSPAVLQVAVSLVLTPQQLAAAAEQLCACALAQPPEEVSTTGGGLPRRALRWSTQQRQQQQGQQQQQQSGALGDLAAEAAEALQLLLLQTAPRVERAASVAAAPQPPHLRSDRVGVGIGGDDGGGGGSPEATAGAAAAAVVPRVVGRLVAAMKPPGGAAEGAAQGQGKGEEEAAGRREVALRLAVQLAPQQGPQAVGEATTTVPGGNAGAGVFAAALLDVMTPVVVGLRGAEGDEEWLLDCLRQLSQHVLPSLAWSPGAAAVAAQGGGGSSGGSAADVASAAHRMVRAVLTAAATERETIDGTAAAVGGGGSYGGLLPFASSASSSGGGDGVRQAMTGSSLSTEEEAEEDPLRAAWCGAVQRLVACCDDRQQLDIALEAADCVADAAAAEAAGTAASPLTLPARLPLACAALAGLRPALLAPHSTQALADGLLRLLVLSHHSASQPGPQGLSAAGAARDAASGPPAAVAVALAAVVNRWQDADALDTWLASSLRPALLQPLLLRNRGSPQTAPAASAAAAAAAAAVLVRAAGWVGRALALRNHPALKDVVQALLTCLTPPGAAAVSASTGSGRESSSSASAASAMEVDEACPGAATTAAAPVECDRQAAGAAVTAGEGEMDGAAALAAAKAFGVLVADVAGCGGVCLAARPAQAVSRVLWQQRTYSLCVQAVEDHMRLLHQQQQQPGGPPAEALPLPVPLPQPLPLPLAVAVAVARLAAGAPRALTRQDAPRLAPLLLRSVLTLSRALVRASQPAPASPSSGSAGAGAAAVAPRPAAAAAAAAAAVAAAGALREALAVVADWLWVQGAQPCTQLGQVLQGHTGVLVDCLCAAAAVGAQTPWRGAQQQHHHYQQNLAATGVTSTSSSSTSTAEGLAALPAGAAAAVREEALRCCTALMDAVPYHALHPLRSQVLDAVLLALDDNRRSVRQLAVRARRVWSDR